MITIRPATAADQEALGRFGGALMRQHHAADPQRFIQVEHPETGYGRFLVSQLTNPAGVVLVADRSGEVVGYIWADVEGISWKDLRGPCGFVHDIFVDESARGLGAGRALMKAAVDWIRTHGRTQVVLWTKTRNDHAKALFRNLGFRSTMTEMTLDAEPAEPGEAEGMGHEDEADPGKGIGRE
jgi:GNAT superfamily N-acetyltransferase